MSVFASLDTYYDDDMHSAAVNMAIDEALLESARVPSIRFYRWRCPALSFGYFGRFAEVISYADGRDLVRRWTGGGVVLHGHDLTYSIVIPSSNPVFGESSISIHAAVHAALCKVLIADGERAELAAVAGLVDVGAAITRRGYDCFMNPVHADVMIEGRKIAGAAQRRTRTGLLHQGSIQGVDLGNGWTERFAKGLSRSGNVRDLPGEVYGRAKAIAARKYATQGWLRKR